MAKVTFTKNVTAENRKNGLWLLGYYWRNSVISKAPYYPITNWDGMIKFLDSNYPTYIEALGDWLKQIPSDKMIEAMKNAAARKLADYPRPAYFENEIMKLTGYSTLSTLGDAVSETVSDLGTGLVWTARLALVAVIVIGIGYAITISGVKIKIPKVV